MSLNTKQNEQLLRGINPKRVLHLRGQSHLAGWDVKAHLTRIFGFEGWDKKLRSIELVFETHGLPDGSKKGWYVTYRCQMTLIIRDPSGNVVREIDGAATGSAENQPSRGDAHDLALKNSVTYALKVCATDLGDQFGLSLYNDGSTKAIVMQTLAGHDDVEQAVPDEINPDSDPEAQREQPAEGAAVPANGNGHRAAVNGHTNGNGQRAQQQTGELDPDAQEYADEAHEAQSLSTVRVTRQHAEAKGKLDSLVRNPATGRAGILGPFLDYHERRLTEIDEALAALQQAAKKAKVPDQNELDIKVKEITGASIMDATAAQLRDAAVALVAVPA